MAASDFPTELSDTLKEFDGGLKKLKEVLTPLLAQNMSTLSVKLSPLQHAQLDLAVVYTINSLFWMYLRTIGQNPKEHDIKQELERIRSYMTRAKEIVDKEKAPRLDKSAAKRFVTHSLWEPKDKEAKATADAATAESDSEDSETEEPNPKKKKIE